MNRARAPTKDPADPEAITSSWLTEALHSTGVVDRAVVRSFKMERLGMEARKAWRRVDLERLVTFAEDHAVIELV